MEHRFASGGRAFALDPQTGALDAIRREAVPLSARQAAVLAYFVANPGRQVSVQEIADAAWGGAAPDGAVDQAVRAVMAALGDDPAAPLFIEPLSGRGYRFCGGVAGGDDLAAAPAPTDARGILAALSSAGAPPHAGNLPRVIEAARQMGEARGADQTFAEASRALSDAARRGERLPPVVLETMIDAVSGWV